MCVGIPMEIIGTDGLRAIADDEGTARNIDMALVGEQPEGTWVLTFLGAAREVIAEEEALKIQAAVSALKSVMGGTIPEEDAFADIEERGPQLPPHLQAALDAGKSTA